MASRKIQQQHGFTLIEVLISIVILSVGLLGVAGMQATSMSNNHQAFVKTQAANMAADMADRIRANADAAADYGNFSSTEPPADPGCITAGCTSAELVDYDLFQWSQPFGRNQPALPGGRGFISWDDNGAGLRIATITILWREPNNGNIDFNQCPESPNGPAFNQAEDEACYQLSFRL